MSEKALRYLAHSVFRNGMAAGIPTEISSEQGRRSGSSRHRTQTASRPRFCSSTSSASSITREAVPPRNHAQGTTSVALPGHPDITASCMRKWTSSPARTSRDPRPRSPGVNMPVKHQRPQSILCRPSHSLANRPGVWLFYFCAVVLGVTVSITGHRIVRNPVVDGS